MPNRPLRWSQAAGAALLLLSAGGMAAVLLWTGLATHRAGETNKAWVKSLALDRMSWVPSGRPARTPHRHADRRFDPHLAYPPPDPADLILPSPFFTETKHEARH